VKPVELAFLPFELGLQLSRFDRESGTIGQRGENP
jgi:hypothetical protein